MYEVARAHPHMFMWNHYYNYCKLQASAGQGLAYEAMVPQNVT